MTHWNCRSAGISPLLPMILLLGLWFLCSLAATQEICSSSGTLTAPRLFLDRLSAHQGDTVVLTCLVPLDAPMTRIVFCKDGKEISVQAKERNKPIYDSPHPVSRESEGAFSCRYQLKDDNNQESNSLPSEPRYLHVADDRTSPTLGTFPDIDGSGQGTSPQGPAVPLWVSILRSALVLLLLVSAPIITCILRKTAVVSADGQRVCRGL